MLLRLLTVLLCLTALHAAQPTLTSISTLGGGTEDTPYTITYAAVLAASDASGDTQRFVITLPGSGSLASRAHGSTDAWITIAALPFYLDPTVDVRWTPSVNTNGIQTACLVRANDGLGSGGLHDSATNVTVNIYLTEVGDPQTATSFVNARTLTDARPIAVTEDTWVEFTYADLVTHTATTEVDGDAFWYVISALGDGTLATSSGGATLVVGDSIASGESLWWRPSADRFTKPGATADLDEPAVHFATLTVRKLHNATTYNLTGIQLSSTIDGVDDPFIDHGISSGFTPVSIVRGHSITMTTAEWLAHIQDFVNTDRDASIKMWLGTAASTAWKLAGFDPAFPDTPQNELTGIDVGGVTYPDGWSVRLTPPTDLGVGTYALDDCLAYDEVTSQLSHVALMTIRIVEPSSGDSGGGDDGGTCGGGSSLSLLALVLFAAIGLIRQGRR